MTSPTPGASIHCSVAYASPDLQWHVELELPAGSTASDALAAARARRAVVDATPRGTTSDDAMPPWDDVPIGVFGQPCARDQVLVDGDRVELYRPLQADPRERRRSRVQASRRGKAGSSR